MTTKPNEAPPLEPTPTRSGLTAEIGWRLAAHALTLGLLLASIWIARLELPRSPAVGLELFAPTAAPETGQVQPVSALPALEPLAQAETGAVNRLALLDTDIPTRPRYTIETYTVQKGDTVFGIAARFNIKPDTIIWGNPELVDQINQLRPGKVLNILPIDGALRIVQPGDTLEKIATVFHGTLEEIIEFAGNDLDPSDPQIKEGQAVIIPGGWRETVTWSLPVVSRARGPGGGSEPGSCPGGYSGPTGSYTFVWPANNHSLSGWDYSPNTHPGIDIAAGLGAPIYASDTGVVVFSGWSTRGYGNLVIIDHGNSWQTAYAHLSQINYACGQTIYQGQLLGLAGSTGNSTGAHLHFEMRSDLYGRVNPWLYLP